jgi:hypothetical protein
MVRRVFILQPRPISFTGANRSWRLLRTNSFRGSRREIGPTRIFRLLIRDRRISTIRRLRTTPICTTCGRMRIMAPTSGSCSGKGSSWTGCLHQVGIWARPQLREIGSLRRKIVEGCLRLGPIVTTASSSGDSTMPPVSRCGFGLESVTPAQPWRRSRQTESEPRSGIAEATRSSPPAFRVSLAFRVCTMYPNASWRALTRDSTTRS